MLDQAWVCRNCMPRHHRPRPCFLPEGSERTRERSLPRAQYPVSDLKSAETALSFALGALNKTVGRQRTALQKNVNCALPIWANAAKTKPNKPCVASLAIFSTRVKAFRASALLEAGHISVMTPLAAGAVPEANGSKKAA